MIWRVIKGRAGVVFDFLNGEFADKAAKGGGTWKRLWKSVGLSNQLNVRIMSGCCDLTTRGYLHDWRVGRCLHTFICSGCSFELCAGSMTRHGTIKRCARKCKNYQH